MTYVKEIYVSFVGFVKRVFTHNDHYNILTIIHSDDSYICPICLDEDNEDYIYAELKKCNHIFHETCIKRWTRYGDTCPLCVRIM